MYMTTTKEVLFRSSPEKKRTERKSRFSKSLCISYSLFTKRTHFFVRRRENSSNCLRFVIWTEHLKHFQPPNMAHRRRRWCVMVFFPLSLLLYRCDIVKEYYCDTFSYTKWVYTQRNTQNEKQVHTLNIQSGRIYTKHNTHIHTSAPRTLSDRNKWNVWQEKSEAREQVIIISVCIHALGTVNVFWIAAFRHTYRLNPKTSYIAAISTTTKTSGKTTVPQSYCWEL